ncbi:UDP-N-acetylmuramate dehydrogenase [Cardinium endosymbiont of Oedothorax gibbosus]|uniref:UDP-N-acetylmuramate dehydrogenase n=1 Tax=Cardinium endosymbiont of Oedothorax gibbosus TaxID=931101 RepID=UPI002024695A|nr:UDP-N-acetylmuramate dehydrogenase [Cardinium endosymbiont of Oedothorax gibbosus]CAH2559847.1 UDP-N-acetylenolpyruvoylglucosamine reductase [Cardinium endosymbiont of Oedothorax gibbosus]
MHFPLQSLNSFKIPAFSADYIQFNSLKDIEDFCAAVNVIQSHFYILGGGSNTLFTRDFPGYILHVQLPGMEVIEETFHKVLIKAAAGVPWHQLVLFCITKGYGGIENLSFIPGTVGGAPIQNIGAYGIELKDVLDTIEAIELATGKKTIFKPSACGFGYRTSFFKTKWQNQYLITGITLALHKEKKFSIEYEAIQNMLIKMEIKQLSFKAISDAIIAIRKQKLPDPAILGNSGSFFENPLISMAHYQWLKQQYPSLIAFSTQNKEQIKISAAWLIERAGFKGLRQGNAGIYPLHALILVNYGGATGKDIIDLATQIKQKVKNQFNITLIPEVNIVGDVVE